jgi:aconitate hydratase
VLSGNRNFEGRIHPRISNTWLTSPALVVIAALAGELGGDWTHDAVAHTPDGRPVTLADLWPEDAQIAAVLRGIDLRADAVDKVDAWDALAMPKGPLFPWHEDSLFLQPPPFFDEAPQPLTDLGDARVLLALGDGVTTDHISPVGRIEADSPAGRLIRAARTGPPGSYGAYRANHAVMMRGTFAHPLLANRLAPGAGPRTTVEGDGIVDIFDAAMHYRARGVPTVVLAGTRYGMGSARDWAAKGTRMLGVRAVLAEGFERIHRANLIGAGVVPITVPEVIAKAAVGPETVVQVRGLAGMDRLHAPVRITLLTPGAAPVEADGLCRIDTPTELSWIRAGGVFAMARDRISPPG